MDWLADWLAALLTDWLKLCSLLVDTLCNTLALLAEVLCSALVD
jgi:hypothetical protein